MKKLFTFFVAVLLTASVFAQSPNKMSYQAVVRDLSNNLVANQAVGMKICILQGSISGSSVYEEIFNPNPITNSNGLVTVEIGGGVPLSGNFTTIDWSAGLYFIKTETDPTGGTNYTIIGVSQLLSVPYALHAKTAESITGAITETDPLYTAWDKTTGISITESQILDLDHFTTADETDPFYGASVASGITATDTTNWNNKLDSETDPVYGTSIASGITGIDTTNWNSKLDTETDPVFTAWDKDYADLINTPFIPTAPDGSETKVTAGTNVTVTGSGTTAAPYIVGTTDTLAIGDSYQGGLIFWLDATGQHGLIAATTEQGMMQWYNGTYRYTGTTGDGLYAGSMNTALIVAAQMADNQSGNFAAKVCADYSVTVGGVTYGDWYLPSKYELNLLYLQKTVVGGIIGGWSSTESDNHNAWIQGSDGLQFDIDKIYTPLVRAVRAF